MVTVSFDYPAENVEGESLHIQADWVQLTYTDLRVAPDGDTLAVFIAGDTNVSENDIREVYDYWEIVEGNYKGRRFTDIVIG